MLAFDIEDGQLKWHVSRDSQHDLSAVDEQRLLLSGDRLEVLSAADGKKFYASDPKGVLGRPAVTPKYVLASADSGEVGRLIRLDLSDYSLSTMEVPDPDALLGNLVSVGGKLIAANAIGVCGYLNYEVSHKEMQNRLAAVASEKKGAIFFDLSQLAFNARRFEDAHEYLDSCRKATPEDDTLQQQIKPWYYRTYIALGNQADKPQEMLELFRLAEQYATTDQEKAHLKLRMAKAYEAAGDFAASATAAQELSEQFAKEELVNVDIGPKADVMARIPADAKLLPGKQLAQEFLLHLIQLHGQQCYAAFDSQARAAFDEARAVQDADAMASVHERWPHSKCACDALFASAEALYRKAAKATGDEATELLNKSCASLGRSHTIPPTVHCGYRPRPGR